MFHNIQLKTVGVAALVSLSAGMAAQAQTILTTGNGIIRNSLCVGGDCQSGISFDDSTLILKENNTRIKFSDTSTGNFPRNDWELEANSSVNGGPNRFSILDCGTASDNGGCGSPVANVFSVEAGAGSNALYVDDGGRVGFGTGSPVAQLHVKHGNTPTLRLEQDTSSGFGAQIWDVAGNEANFFIRDASNGSTLPFRLFPGAPSNAITIAGTGANSGNVGFGTTSPTASLHVRRTNGTAQVFVEEASSTTANNRILLQLTNNGSAQLSLANSNDSTDWRFQNFNDTFRATKAGTGTVEMEVDASGNMTIAGTLTTAGSCSIGCDRVFDADYALPSIEDHAALMWSQKYLPNVGPTPETGALNVSDKVLRMLNELEHAHIYIADLNATVKAQGARIDRLTALLDVQ